METVQAAYLGLKGHNYNNSSSTGAGSGGAGGAKPGIRHSQAHDNHSFATWVTQAIGWGCARGIEAPGSSPQTRLCQVLGHWPPHILGTLVYLLLWCLNSQPQSWPALLPD